MKRLLIIALICCSGFSCQTEEQKNYQTKVDKESEKAAIIKMTSERFERLVAAGSGEKMAEVYIQNTVETPVYLPQNDMVLVGREAIKEWGTQFFEKYDLAFGDEGPQFEQWVIYGNVAIHHYVVKGYFIERLTGDSIRTEQKATDTFEKINGEWLFSSHMWNTNSMDVPMFNPDCTK
jgi:hypothetical protein